MKQRSKLRFLFCVHFFCFLSMFFLLQSTSVTYFDDNILSDDDLFHVAAIPCVVVHGYQEGLSDEQLYGNGEENVLGNKSISIKPSVPQIKTEGISSSKTKNVLENMSESTTEKASEKTPESTTEKASENMPESTTEKVIESTTKVLKAHTTETINKIKTYEQDYQGDATTARLNDNSSQNLKDTLKRSCDYILEHCQYEIDIRAIKEMVTSDSGIAQCQLEINGQEVLEGIITKPGEYDVKCIVTDLSGAKDSCLVTVTITEKTKEGSTSIYIVSIVVVLGVGVSILIYLKRKEMKVLKEEQNDKRSHKKKHK